MKQENISFTPRTLPEIHLCARSNKKVEFTVDMIFKVRLI